MLPPSGPVTITQSPTLAPDRSTGPRSVASPSTVTEMASGPSQLFVSPPTSGTPNASAIVAHAQVEFLRQFPAAGSRQADADDGRGRHTGHRRDVAQVDRHRLAADAARPGLGEDEATPVQEHVGRDEQRPGRRPEDGRVVARADEDVGRRRGALAEPVDVRELARRGAHRGLRVAGILFRQPRRHGA